MTPKTTATTKRRPMTKAQRNARRRKDRALKKALAAGAAFEPAKKLSRARLEADLRLVTVQRDANAEQIARMQAHEYWQPSAVGVGHTKYFRGANRLEDPKVELVPCGAGQTVNVYEKSKDGAERVGVAARPTQPAIAIIADGQLMAVLDRQSLAWFVRALKMLAPRGM